MENASSALKTAFAIFVFVIAISILFSLITKITNTANTVLYYTDKTNFYEYQDGYNSSLKRNVTEEEVISALYNQTANNSHIYIYIRGRQVYPLTDNEETLQSFIDKYLNSGKTYSEEDIECNIDGIYKYAEDDTKVTLKKGRTETYIYYTQN